MLDRPATTLNQPGLATAAGGYTLSGDGIHRPASRVEHRSDEYEEGGFDLLMAMQQRHFWYRGRHRFLLEAVERHRAAVQSDSMVDLGGGCGGWLRYLAEQRPAWNGSLALADSSEVALAAAGTVLPSSVARYQIDLMNLGWKDQWDSAFLLDVIEHLPDDAGALAQVHQALKPGGHLFVTTPALPAFWSYNDDLARHLRRYTRADLADLARASGFRLLDARYFMFFLSPLYWLARSRPGVSSLSEAQKRELFAKAHQVPAKPINEVCAAVFQAESPLGHWLRFPWGTSVLGVFQKV